MLWKHLDMDARKRAILEHCESGMSADEMAAALVVAGYAGVTRNVVVGMIHRHQGELKLKIGTRRAPVSRKVVSVAGEKRTRVHVARLMQKRERATEREYAGDRCPEVPDHSDADIPPPKCVPLLELSSTSCRWRVDEPNDGDFLFCGHDVKPGRPYCPAHCRVAYAGLPGREPATETRKE